MTPSSARIYALLIRRRLRVFRRRSRAGVAGHLPSGFGRVTAALALVLLGSAAPATAARAQVTIGGQGGSPECLATIELGSKHPFRFRDGVARQTVESGLCTFQVSLCRDRPGCRAAEIDRLVVLGRRFFVDELPPEGGCTVARDVTLTTRGRTARERLGVVAVAGDRTDRDSVELRCRKRSPPRRNCPNGVVETGETCDDGNDVNGDGCDVNCTASACGNGVVAGDEECDGGAACDPTCRLTACGNGFRSAGEACDFRAAVNDCPAPTPICDTACRCVAPPATCTCGPPGLDTLHVTSRPSVGACGRIERTDGAPPIAIPCGRLDVGDGLSVLDGQPLQATIALAGQCEGDTFTITRRGEGSVVAPIAIDMPPLSVCLVNTIEADVSGTVACGAVPTNDSRLRLPIAADVYLTADTPACPLCVAAHCSGGATPDATCRTADGADGPSPDCRPVGTPLRLQLALDLRSGANSRPDANAPPADDGQFCPFCRDLDSSAFGLCGDTNDRVCNTVDDCTACGGAVACSTAAACAPPRATCEQHRQGAFGQTDATRITLDDGRGGPPVDGRWDDVLNAIFCVPPTFSAIDSIEGLPGPGVLALPVTLRFGDDGDGDAAVAPR